MAKIRRLSEQLANQIAAGEVIERPSSAAKELAENSLDAGASRIDVIVGEGGRSLRISDDGEGMSPEDAALAFERFATSKIQDVDDLFCLRTMGFRGEALASIAAVARVELTTRRPGDEAGTRIRIVGGGKPELGPVGCPEGTTIAIDDLFFNTPARLKFLKSPSTEMSHVVETLTALSLAHPKVAFTCRSGSRTALDTTGARDLAEAAALVLGAEVGPRLLKASAESPSGQVDGLVAPPELIRGDRAKQWLFINGRPVRHPALARAVDEAYSGHIPDSRHPIYVVSLTVDPERIDFNVHPTKKEVRLADASHLYSLIREAVGRALRQAPSVRRALLVRHMDARPGQSQPMSPQQAMELYRPAQGTVSVEGERQVFGGVRQDSGGMLPVADSAAQGVGGFPAAAGDPLWGRRDAGAPRRQSEGIACDIGSKSQQGGGDRMLFEAESGQQGREPFPWDNLRLLGQLHNTYLVLEHPGGLYIVDQHNSHERYLYEQIGPGNVPAQELLLPRPLDLAPDSAAALELHVEGLARLGFSVEPPAADAHQRTGQGTGQENGGGAAAGHWVLRAVPATLPAEEAESTLVAILEDLAGGSDVPAADLANRWRVTVACHSAIKAGDRLSEDAMKRLLAQWRSCEQPFTCPHGRPTAVLYPLSELHRRCMRGMQTR